jgi:uncharacterized membrane protein (UPF0127 family)
MRKYQKYIKVVAVVTGSALIMYGIGVLLMNQLHRNNSELLTINGNKIRIEIAKSSQKKSEGLCCRDSLPDDHGMLFVYDQPGDYRFWMKDTKIPLDMIWIDSNKKIVHIEEDVQPSSYPKSFGSNDPAQYVLETNAGFVKKYQIQKRDNVAF